MEIFSTKPNKTIKELLQIMLDNHEHLFSLGLCNYAIVLRGKRLYDASEFYSISIWLRDNLPHPEYKRFEPYGTTDYSFPFGQWPPREEWIKQQIELL